MKRLIIAFVLISLLFYSCESWNLIDPEVKFYIDGKEITTDDYSVSLNSYLEVRIESYAPQNSYEYLWREIHDFPTNLRTDKERFSIIYSSGGATEIEDGKYGSKEVSEFRMMFSDSICQPGDHFLLRVILDGHYERTLNFHIE